MSNSLPSHPNLDHLREQAKDLLASFRAGEPEAVDVVRWYLPAIAKSKRLAGAQIPLSLSDAQSAIARKHGFSSWPKMVRHIEALRKLHGAWLFTSIEVEGSVYPEGVMNTSSLSIDGNIFKMTSAEASYVGLFIIDVETVPKTIDIHFTEGPEAGNNSLGIFEFDGRELKICVGLNGAQRPTAFETTPGSGHALETFRRGE